MTTFIAAGKHKHKIIEVTYGQHFSQRFIERWGHESDLLEYLNNTLNEGYFINDHHTHNGIYFPTARIYIPLAPKTGSETVKFAITFLYMTMQAPIASKQIRTVHWVSHE